VFVSKTSGIAAVTKAHWSTVQDVWKTCSNTTDAHAAAFSGPKKVPTPEEFTAMVAAIERVIEEVKAARTSGNAAVVAEPKPAPALAPHA